MYLVSAVILNYLKKVSDDGGGEVRVGEEGGVSPSQVSAVLLALSHTFAMDFDPSSSGS